jgi:hypothetical protein
VWQHFPVVNLSLANDNLINLLKSRQNYEKKFINQGNVAPFCKIKNWEDYEVNISLSSMGFYAG